MTVLVLGLIVFVGVHCTRIFAPAWRDQQIAQRGDGAWKGVYSLLSIAGFVLLIWGYGLARENSGDLYPPVGGARGTAFIAMPIALILILASQFPAGYIKLGLRHPMLWGVLIWSIIHLLNNGDTASVLLFGAFAIWSFVNLISCYRRPYEVPVATKVWPDGVAVVGGVVLTWLFVAHLHSWLFGVAIV